MSRWSCSVLGLLGCVVMFGCHGGESDVKTAPSAEPTTLASGAGTGSGAAAKGANVQSKGSIGGKPFSVVCAASPGALVTETPEATTLACHDTGSGFDLQIKLVSPKVGRLDASPNHGASVITLHAGSFGSPDTTDGGTSANLFITAWGPPGSPRTGNFAMNWYDNGKLNLKEGRLEGSFSL